MDLLVTGLITLVAALLLWLLWGSRLAWGVAIGTVATLFTLWFITPGWWFDPPRAFWNDPPGTAAAGPAAQPAAQATAAAAPAAPQATAAAAPAAAPTANAQPQPLVQGGLGLQGQAATAAPGQTVAPAPAAATAAPPAAPGSTAQPAAAGASTDPLCTEAGMEAALGGLDVYATEVACAFRMTGGGNNAPMWTVPIGAGVFATLDEGDLNVLWVGGTGITRTFSDGTFRSAASTFNNDPCAWEDAEQQYAVQNRLPAFTLGNFSCP